MKERTGGVLILVLVGLLPQVGLAETILVDVASTCTADCGATWTAAWPDLQAAINAATAPDEIWVVRGSYGPIELRNGVRVYGGFSGGETVRSARNARQNVTVINGGGQTQAVRSVGHDASTVLDGFTITDGAANSWAEAGGGMLLRDSDTVVHDCVFTANSAVFAGGAVANYNGSPAFVNCTFANNGPVGSRETPKGGGAVYNRRGDPAFINCLFHGNEAFEGGAVASVSGTPHFRNCTFTENRASRGKGGALFDNPGSAVLENSIVWANAAATTGYEEIYCYRKLGTTRATFTNIKGGWAGEANLNADPKFTNPAGSDFRLASGSPCRDVGRPDFPALGRSSIVPSLAARDLASNARLNGASIDMGALEWR